MGLWGWKTHDALSELFFPDCSSWGIVEVYVHWGGWWFGRFRFNFHLHLDDPNFSQHGGRMLGALHIPGSGETQHLWGLISLGHRHC